MSMTLFEQLQNAGIPTDSHCSDLYFPVNEQTTKMVNEYRFKSNVTTFTSQIDGKRWYDAPFAFTPYWDKVQRRSTVTRETPATFGELMDRQQQLLDAGYERS